MQAFLPCRIEAEVLLDLDVAKKVTTMKMDPAVRARGQKLCRTTQ
jgi:hypothetical protein